jgi:hypothetical protein
MQNLLEKEQVSDRLEQASSDAFASETNRNAQNLKRKKTDMMGAERRLERAHVGWSPMNSDELVARAASSPAPWESESEHPSVAIGNLRNQRMQLKNQMRVFERNFEYQHGWRPGPIDKREDTEYARLTRELKRCDAALRLARGVHNGPTVHDGGAGRKAALRDYAMSSMREPPRGQRAFPSGPRSSATLTAAALHHLAAVGDDGDDVISSSAGSPCMRPLGAASLIAGATRAGLGEASRWNYSTAEHGSSSASNLAGCACHGACCGASLGGAAAVTALPPSAALDSGASEPDAPHCSQGAGPCCSAATTTTGRHRSAVVSREATGRQWRCERRHALWLLAVLRALSWGCASAPTAPEDSRREEGKFKMTMPVCV